MNMLKTISRKNKIIILSSILVVVTILYLILIVFNLQKINKYNNQIYPNIYLDDLDLSDFSYENAKERIKYYNDNILSKNIKLKVNNNIYEYPIRDLGVNIDVDKSVEQIRVYQDNLTFREKVKSVNGKVKTRFEVMYNFDNAKLAETINSLKLKVDKEPINGYFNTDGAVSYVKGTAGYHLNVNKSVEEVSKIVNTKYKKGMAVELVGDVINASGNDSYASIDTLTSSYVTTFMPNTYLRNINLNNALRYINGSVVEPGEVFSYCKKAGPFDKAGYVFYYEFVGNGVCQIATTTYNAALLGGLEIVKRYPHDKKSLYIEGGLDATVASYSSGWCVDMQFRNTYKYPIYIKAYSEGGRAHVEFWSNSKAKEGKEYKTSSVQIGKRGYRSFLHTFKDGKEIKVEQIAETWYLKD